MISSRLSAAIVLLLLQAGHFSFGAVTIDPSNTNILYSGRFNHSNPSQPRFGWSGTSIIANFEGTSLKASFDDEGDNYLYVIVDDGEPEILNLNSNSTEYTLASGLTDEVHKIEIVKRTEGYHGHIKFNHLKLDDGRNLAAPPARPPLKLEFFGDSNAAGYSAEDIHDAGASSTNDSYFTFPGITSRMLNAEHSNVSVSGITVTGGAGISSVWDKTYYPGGSSPTWDFGNYSPDAVIINLGANDYYASRTENQIKNGWKNFITDDLRTVYPDAHVVLVNSYGWANNEPADYVADAVAELHSQGDTNVSSVLFPWLWGQTHAVTFEQAGFANILAGHLATELGLPQPAPNELSGFGAPGQVANGSFENSDLTDVPDGWRYWGNGTSYLEDVGDAHSGVDYVRVTGDSSGFWHANNAIPGHQYTATGWMRRAGAGNGGTQGKLRIEFKDQQQSIISVFTETESVGDFWEEVSVSATAPPNAWGITISMITNSGDSVDFDSIVLQDLDAPILLPADFDQDHDIDSVDLAIWNRAFADDDEADANGDGYSDGYDFLVWQSSLNNSSPSSIATIVPEPTSFDLLAILGLLFAPFRKQGKS